MRNTILQFVNSTSGRDFLVGGETHPDGVQSDGRRLPGPLAWRMIERGAPGTSKLGEVRAEC